MTSPIFDNTGDGPFGPIVNGTQIVFFEYRPNKAAGFAFLALFGVATLSHLVLFFMLRAWFFIPFLLGGIAEAFGYFGRAQASDRPSEAGPFILQNLLILVAAPFLAATVYMSLGRIARALDAEKQAFISLRWMTRLYVLIDFGCIGTQFVGSIIPASGDPTAIKQARVILLVGIIIQFSALAVFMAQIIFLEMKIARNPPLVLIRDPSIKWRRHFRAVEVTAVLLIVRAVVRAVEYLQGPKGEIMSHEVYLYVFDAALMLLVMIVFLGVHPKNLVRECLELREAFGDIKPRKAKRCCHC